MNTSYLIAASPRIGGNWLCSELYRAHMGRPGEFLNWLLEDDEASLSDLRKLWLKYTVDGVYGVKAHWTPEFDLLDLDDVLPAASSRAFIQLIRHDRLAQATSYAIARKYGNWHAPQPAFGEIELNDDEIEEAAQDLATIRDGWTGWFARYRIEPLVVSYEEMFADIGGVIDRIVAHVEAARREDVST